MSGEGELGTCFDNKLLYPFNETTDSFFLTAFSSCRDCQIQNCYAQGDSSFFDVTSDLNGRFTYETTDGSFFKHEGDFFRVWKHSNGSYVALDRQGEFTLLPGEEGPAD
mmetsp:Transcript_23005/g.35556  ORF Transcript_23005/g.35556 Transcript_23005/m.35556 type:complete len:109 (+) Transcript_23005:521-847(+)